MTKLILIAAVLALLATAIPAQARNCNTTCTQVGTQQFCNTYCY